jgi:hypothetical protein
VDLADFSAGVAIDLCDSPVENKHFASASSDR